MHKLHQTLNILKNLNKFSIFSQTLNPQYIFQKKPHLFFTKPLIFQPYSQTKKMEQITKKQKISEEKEQKIE